MGQRAIASSGSVLLGLIVAARPKQWAKNVFLFIPLVTALKLADTRSLAQAGFAGVIFCAIASAGYFFNDLADVEADRQHPRKRMRPLAAGRISRGHALGMGSTLLLGGIAGAFLVNWRFFLLVLAYIALTVAYNSGLKHAVLLDVFALATFFVIRVIAGAVAIDVPISPWLYLCTILGALFLGLAKRRHELLLLGDDAASHRQILSEYSADMLEQMITIVTASLIMAYSLYTFTAENLPRDHSMMITIPIVIFGIFRYLYLVHRRDAGGSPEEVLFSDRALLATIALLGLAAVAVLYLRGH